MVTSAHKRLGPSGSSGASMNRRVKLGLVPFVLLLAVLLCFYFMVATRVVDKIREKFTITAGVEILSLQEQVMEHNVPAKLSQPPQQQGPIMEHQVTQKPTPAPQQQGQGATMQHNVPVKPSRLPAPRQQGPIMEHKIPNGTLAPQQQGEEAIMKNKGQIMQHKMLQKLPQSVIDGIKTFIFFVGHPCSGHSIVGSLIDSHPHMVVSHEYTLFQKLSTGVLAPTKPDIFNKLWKESQAVAGKHGARGLDEKGYTLYVDGLYEGKYVDYIDVIGDKRGDRVIEMFMDHPNNWSKVYRILSSLNVTLKVIHVIRNPYDNIATLAFFVKTSRTRTFGSVKQSNKSYTFSSNHILKWTKFYFRHHEGIVNAKKKYNLDIIEVHNKDLVSDPRGTLVRLCDQLGVTCSDDYLEKCSKKIFKTESKTRCLINWTGKQLELIQQNIKKYSCLKDYTFDSM